MLYDMSQIHKLKKFGELTPAAWKGFLDWDKAVMADGAIPARTKELIAVAVAMTTQCPYCIEIHTKQPRPPAAPRRSWPSRSWSPRRCARRSDHAWDAQPGVRLARKRLCPFFGVRRFSAAFFLWFFGSQARKNRKLKRRQNAALQKRQSRPKAKQKRDTGTGRRLAGAQRINPAFLISCVPFPVSCFLFPPACYPVPSPPAPTRLPIPPAASGETAAGMDTRGCPPVSAASTSPVPAARLPRPAPPAHRQVGRGCVDGDHQVEVLHDGRRVTERRRIEPNPNVEDGEAFAKLRDLLLARPHLQAEKVYTRHPRQRGEFGERD